MARNKVNGKIYVGQTVMPLERRIASHLVAKTGIFPNALRKYGVQSFEFSVIDVADSQDALKEKEIFWIGVFDCRVPNGYNITQGGNGGMLGVKQSEKTRRKHSESAKGKNAGEKNGMFGKSFRKGAKHSEIAKQLNSDSHKKLWADPNYREKLVASHKGKGHTEATREKMRRSQRIRRQKERSVSA